LQAQTAPPKPTKALQSFLKEYEMSFDDYKGRVGRLSFLE